MLYYLQTLIAHGGNDIVNYERLETLGDACLKYLASLILYTYLPDKDEGKLTHIKGKIVGNRNLFYSGHNFNLGSMIKVGFRFLSIMSMLTIIITYLAGWL